MEELMISSQRTVEGEGRGGWVKNDPPATAEPMKAQSNSKPHSLIF